MERSSIIVALYCGMILFIASDPPETIVTIAALLVMAGTFVTLAIRDRS